MKAETIKVKMPIITEEELQCIDDNFEEIVDKAERIVVAKKEQIMWQRLLSKQKKIIKDLKERNDKLESQYRNGDFRCITLEQRNERLNNIINELEKELNQEYLIWQCNNRSYGKTIKYGINIAREHYYKRLQELKEKYR